MLPARVERLPKNNEMEEVIACFESGKQGARNLNSKQRSAEVNYAYREILNTWPTEAKVQALESFSTSKEEP
jgi:hypothetical protein